MVPLSCAAQMKRPVIPAAWAEAGAAELLGANRAMTSAENPATTSAEMLISRINREPRRPRNMMGTPCLSREASVRQANSGGAAASRRTVGIRRPQRRHAPGAAGGPCQPRSAGVGGVSIGEVERSGVDEFLGGLAAQLRGGRYRPRPLRRVHLPKPGKPGQFRPLGIPGRAPARWGSITEAFGRDRATRRAGREISSWTTVSRSQRWRVCSTRWPSAEVTILGDARRNPTRHGHKTIVAALFRHQHRYLAANHGNIQRALERAKMCALLEKAAPHQGHPSGESLCRRWAKDR